MIVTWVSHTCVQTKENSAPHTQTRTHTQTDRRADRRTDRQTARVAVGADRRGGGSGLAGESQWRDNMAWLSQTKGRGRGGRRIGVSKGGGPCQGGGRGKGAVGGGRGKGAVILSYAYISDYC